MPAKLHFAPDLTSKLHFALPRMPQPGRPAHKLIQQLKRFEFDQKNFKIQHPSIPVSSKTTIVAA
jgi:hypothetical protein